MMAEILSKRLVHAITLSVAVLVVEPAAACDDACCSFPAPRIQLIGYIRAGPVITMEIHDCVDALMKGYDADEAMRRAMEGLPEKKPSGWGDIREIKTHYFVTVVAAGRYPKLLKVPLGHLGQYSTHELLYHWSRPASHGKTLGAKERDVVRFPPKPEGTVAKRQGGLDHVLDRHGNTLISYGDTTSHLTRDTLFGLWNASGVPYFVTEIQTECLSGNDPCRYMALEVYALPDSVDVVFYDGRGGSASEEQRSLLSSLVEQVKRASFRSVKTKKASRPHESTRLLWRNTAETGPHLPGRTLGDLSPAGGFFNAAVNVLIRALLGLPKSSYVAGDDGLIDLAIPTGELDWDEDADLVLIVGDDLPRILQKLKSETTGNIRMLTR